MMKYHDTTVRPDFDSMVSANLQPGRLCPVGGETRCMDVMALSEEWKLRFENVQPEWLNELLSSSLTTGLDVFPQFFGAVSLFS